MDKKMKIADYLMIGATIRIGLEILFLPYAGFFVLLSNCFAICTAIYALFSGKTKYGTNCVHEKYLGHDTIISNLAS